MKIGWFRYRPHEVGYDVYDPGFIFEIVLDAVGHQDSGLLEAYLSACILMYPHSVRTIRSVVAKGFPEHLEFVEKMIVLL